MHTRYEQIIKTKPHDSFFLSLFRKRNEYHSRRESLMCESNTRKTNTLRDQWPFCFLSLVYNSHNNANRNAFPGYWLLQQIYSNFKWLFFTFIISNCSAILCYLSNDLHWRICLKMTRQKININNAKREIKLETCFAYRIRWNFCFDVKKEVLTKLSWLQKIEIVTFKWVHSQALF